MPKEGVRVVPGKSGQAVLLCDGPLLPGIPPLAECGVLGVARLILARGSPLHGGRDREHR